MNTQLLIFIKNPQKGKVKTRLAKTIGDEKALAVYQALLAHTHTISKELKMDKSLYFSSFIPENTWEGYECFLQSPGDLGKKMSQAFQSSFAQNYSKVLIIGSDCLELKPELLEMAEEQLDQYSVVFGPALDGGYYLLGMNRFYPFLFENMPWSTSEVLKESLDRLKKANINHSLLAALSDVDEWKDLPSEWQQRYSN